MLHGVYIIYLDIGNISDINKSTVSQFCRLADYSFAATYN